MYRSEAIPSQSKLPACESRATPFCNYSPSESPQERTSRTEHFSARHSVFKLMPAAAEPDRDQAR
jgi:hypothetical protein